MTYHVGIDICGAFADARLLQTPTTLHDPSEGVNNALALAEQARRILTRSGVTPSDGANWGGQPKRKVRVPRRGHEDG